MSGFDPLYIEAKDKTRRGVTFKAPLRTEIDKNVSFEDTKHCRQFILHMG